MCLILQIVSHEPKLLLKRDFAELDDGCGKDCNFPVSRPDLDDRGYPSNNLRSVVRIDCARIRAHAESSLRQHARTNRQPLCGVGARLCASVSTPRTEYSRVPMRLMM
jgi:hypothetical protein